VIFGLGGNAGKSAFATVHVGTSGLLAPGVRPPRRAAALLDLGLLGFLLAAFVALTLFAAGSGFLATPIP